MKPGCLSRWCRALARAVSSDEDAYVSDYRGETLRDAVLGCAAMLAAILVVAAALAALLLLGLDALGWRP